MNRDACWNVWIQIACTLLTDAKDLCSRAFVVVSFWPRAFVQARRGGKLFLTNA
jgi:hypothetical protein